MERASSVMAGVTHVMIVNGRFLLIPSSGSIRKLEKTQVALHQTFDRKLRIAEDVEGWGDFDFEEEPRGEQEGQSSLWRRAQARRMEG